MIVHTESEIIRAAIELNGRGNRKEIFSRVFKNTKGGARRPKLEKAWKKLRAVGRIVADKHSKHFEAVEITEAA